MPRQLAPRFDLREAEATSMPLKRVYQCSHCAKSFTKNEHLVRHSRTHTSEKPYVCRQCARAFGRRDILTRHIQSVHGQKESSSSVAMPIEPSVLDSRLYSMDLDGRAHPQPPPLPLPLPRPPPFATTERGAGGGAGGLLLLSDAQDAGASNSEAQLASSTAVPVTSLLQDFSDLVGNPAVLELIPPVSGDAHMTTSPLAALHEHASAGGAAPSPHPYSFLGDELAFTAPSASDALDSDLSVFLNNAVPWTWETPDPLATDTADMILENYFRLSYLPGAESYAATGAADRASAAEVKGEASVCIEISRSWPTNVPAQVRDVQKPLSTVTPLERDVDTSTVAILRNELSAHMLSTLSMDLFPDAGFITLALRNFWSYVHPSFPCMHRATFRPKAYPLLTLSLVALGAIYMGHKKARAVADYLYKRVKDKMVALSPEELSWSQTASQSLALIQTAVWGQLYGLLAGNQLALQCSHLYNMPVIGLARSLGAFGNQDIARPAAALDSDPDVEVAWRIWTQAESMKRVGHCLIWQSHFLAALYRGSSPFTIHSLSLEWPAPAELFDAPTAKEWAAACHCVIDVIPSSGYERSPLRDVVADLVADSAGTFERLASRTLSTESDLATIISALALVANSVDTGLIPGSLDGPSLASARRALSTWYRWYKDSRAAAEAAEAADDPRMLLETYHFTMLHLLAPFEALERISGRDGPAARVDPWTVKSVQDWVREKHAREAVLHAGAIWTLVSRSRKRRSGGFLLASAAFHAVLILRSYEKYTPAPISLRKMHPIEITESFDWWHVHNAAIETDPANVVARQFIADGGMCTLQGIVLHQGNGIGSSYSLEAFLCQLEGSGSWGQLEQICGILTLMEAIP